MKNAAILFCLLFVAPAVLQAQGQESEKRSERNNVQPVASSEAEPVQQESQQGGLEKVRPDEPIDLTLELLVRQNDTGRSVFTKRPLVEPEPITTAELDAINPQSKEDEIAIPLRGYPAPDQPPVPNRPIYAEGKLGLNLTTGLRAGISGKAWPFDYHLALDYASTQGFVENGDRSGFSVEAGGGYVIGLDYGIFSGGYMGADARYATQTYRLYAVPEAPERSLLDWGLGATGTASFAGIDVEGKGRIRRARLQDDLLNDTALATPGVAELAETSVEGALTAKMTALGLGWRGKLDVRLTDATPGSINYGALDLSALFELPVLSLRGGAALSLGGGTDGETSARFAPQAELRIFPLNGFVLSGKITGGIRQTTVQGVADLNPYMALNGDLLPEDESLGYELALHLEPAQNWGFRVGASRREFASWLYFDAPLNGQFAPQYDEASVDLITGDFYWNLDSRNEFLAVARYTQGTVGDSLNNLPYMPRWDAEVGYTRRLLSSPISLGGTIRYIGEREGGVARAENNGMLDPAVLVGFEGSYAALQYLDLLLEVRNLLDQDYQLWDGYQERGFYIGLGVRGRF